MSKEIVEKVIEKIKENGELVITDSSVFGKDVESGELKEVSNYICDNYDISALELKNNIILRKHDIILKSELIEILQSIVQESEITYINRSGNPQHFYRFTDNVPDYIRDTIVNSSVW